MNELNEDREAVANEQASIVVQTLGDLVAELNKALDKHEEDQQTIDSLADDNAKMAREIGMLRNSFSGTQGRGAESDKATIKSLQERVQSQAKYIGEQDALISRSREQNDEWCRRTQSLAVEFDDYKAHHPMTGARQHAIEQMKNLRSTHCNLVTRACISQCIAIVEQAKAK